MRKKKGVKNWLLCFSLLLGEDAQAEVTVLVRLEGGGHDKVFARRQVEPRADFAQVDEGLGASFLCVRQEIVLIQVQVGLTLELVNRRSRSDGQEIHIVCTNVQMVLHK